MTIAEKAWAKNKIIPNEGHFLIELFDNINKLDIAYCVERNYDNLPYELNGGDVDLLVYEKNEQKVIEIICSIVKKNNGYVHFLRRNKDCRAIRCFGYNAKGLPWAVPIDLETKLCWKGIEYYDAKNAVKNGIVKNGIKIAAERDATLIACLKELMNHRNVPKKYWDKTIEVFRKNAAYFGEQLENIYGKKGRIFIDLLIGNKFQNLKNVGSELQRALIIRSFIHSPFSFVRKKVVNFLIHCERLHSRPGLMVVVLGPDGAGKTTLIENVRKEFEKLMHINVPTQVRHWRPHLLPRLAKIMGRKIDEQGDSLINPHAGPPSGALISIIRLAYYTIDYFLGYWLLIFPMIAKYPTIFFFDRYYADYYVDPERWKVNPPKWAIKLFEKFVHSPDLFVFISANFAEIRKRKPELDLGEMQEQAVKRKEIAGRLKNVVWIDNSGDLKVSKKKMMEAVFSAFAERSGRMNQLVSR